MRNIIIILKKDLYKIFSNPRLVFSTVLLPGVIIFLVYTFMGNILTSEQGKMGEHVTSITIYDNTNLSTNPFIDLLLTKVNEYKLNVAVKKGTISNEEAKPFLVDGDIDIILINDYIGDKPSFEIFYNQLIGNSKFGMEKIQKLVFLYEKQVLINDYGVGEILIATYHGVEQESKEQGMIISMIFPMLIMTFIFAGALSIGTDAIAGEKERGTLATLLMTPSNRREVVLGKLFATAITTLVSAISSFIGVIASLPSARIMFNLTSSVDYQFNHYLVILLIIFTIALLASSLILLSSTFAKTIKEATMYSMPIYIIAILSSVFTMFNSQSPKELYLYFIPIYNCTLAIKSVLSFSVNPFHILLVVLSSLAYLVIINIVLIKMFNSEKVLFAK